MHRILPLLLVMCVTGPAHAQPQFPDLTFTVVRNAQGRPMRGPLIDLEALRGIKHKPNAVPWSVEMYFTVSKDYPYGDEEIGGQKHWFLPATPVPGDRKDRVQFAVLDCYCTDQYFVIRQGASTMRIDLPDPGAERTALYEHVMARSGSDPSPEVIRFRSGRFTYAELAHEAGYGKLEARLAAGIKDATAAADMKRLAELAEYYRDQPPPALPTEPTIPSPTTEEQWAAFWTEQPPLKEARIVNVNGDTVQVSITGRIMLTGDCSSSMPLFGMEMRTDSGWVERLPLELVQMDCGLPWGDWEERTLVLSLGYWLSVRAPAGKKEPAPGTYRLLFMGGNMEPFASEAFLVK